MPPKSSTKAKKGAKGRKNDPEWRLLHEQETRKRREELLETFMKDKLGKESANSRLNAIKLSWQWRNFLREMKSAELQSETVILQESFEHVLDTKNRIIEALVEEIAESGKQQNNTVTSHMESCTKLLELQNGHLDRMHDWYETQKAKIVDMLRYEAEESTEKHAMALEDLGKIENDFNEKNEKLKNGILNEYQSRKDELLNKSLEEQHTLRVQLNIAVEGLWQQFQQLLRNYHETIKEKKKSFHELKARDDKNAIEIDVQNKKLQKLEEAVGRLKQKLQSYSGEEKDACRLQQMEQKDFSAELNRLRDKIRTERAENEKRLMDLTISSHKAVKYLENTISKGKQILKAYGMCRKYNQSEMVLRMPAIFPCGLDSDNKMAVKRKTPKCYLMSKPSSEETLEHFWRKYNEAYLQSCMRKEENKILFEENAKLRNLLKQYLDGLTNGQQLAREDVLAKLQVATTGRVQ